MAGKLTPAERQARISQGLRLAWKRRKGETVAEKLCGWIIVYRVHNSSEPAMSTGWDSLANAQRMADAMLSYRRTADEILYVGKAENLRLTPGNEWPKETAETKPKKRPRVAAR